MAIVFCLKSFFPCLVISSLHMIVALNLVSAETPLLPLVINTWAFTDATQEAWNVINSGGGSALDAVELGCNICEVEQCDGSVGYGGSPDENGETTLDAMIMDGITHDVGSVGGLRRIKNAISVARAVMMYTTHTLLVGDAATNFAVDMGFKEESLTTDSSIQSKKTPIDIWNRETTRNTTNRIKAPKQEMYKHWITNNCQPNYRQNVKDKETCGPYSPNDYKNVSVSKSKRFNPDVSENNHDTIGMIVIDRNGNVAGGTSTNGANHKVPGRVGDSPIAGSGAYVDNDIGGAAATGDGDVMMRFLASYQVVENMRQGMDPTKGCAEVLNKIAKKYPTFSGALVAATTKGQYGAACHNFSSFHYSVNTPLMKSVKVVEINCTQPFQ